MRPGILIAHGIAKHLVSTFTFSMILSFRPNCTPYCSRDKFQHINLEINSTTEATDSSLRASASVAMYSFPKGEGREGWWEGRGEREGGEEGEGREGGGGIADHRQGGGEGEGEDWEGGMGGRDVRERGGRMGGSRNEGNMR